MGNKLERSVTEVQTKLERVGRSGKEVGKNWERIGTEWDRSVKEIGNNSERSARDAGSV